MSRSSTNISFKKADNTVDKKNVHFQKRKQILTVNSYQYKTARTKLERAHS